MKQGLLVQRLSVAPDVQSLARKIFTGRNPALLYSADRSGPSYLAVEPTQISHALDPEPELELDASAPGPARAVPRWIGVLPYEAERARLESAGKAAPAVDRRAPAPIARPVWLRYGAVAVVQRDVHVVGDDPAALRALRRLLEGPEPTPSALELSYLGVSDSEAEQVAKIHAALECIARGELYQVNLAHKLAFAVRGSSLELLFRLAEAAQNPFSGALDLPEQRAFISTSPELFIHCDAQRRLRTLPIKGTRPRGADAASAALARSELAASEKERAELAMVVDVERNDLNRVCETGSVVAEPARVFASSRLYHRHALVSGRLRRDVSRTALLEATLPSGSVTGAPKVSAMQLIAQLESARRGAYTGAFGALCHDGSLKLAINIRCVSREQDKLEYWVGGGLVADSDAQLEIDERRWKAIQIVRACAAQ